MLRAYTTLLSGYIGWGLFPLYWQLLAHVPALEVTLHRIVWSVPVLALMVIFSSRRKLEFSKTLGSSRQLKLLVVTAILITVNWGVYVWAVAHARVLEASMGYFLTPLINIAAGVLIFHEKLSRLKWLAILLAASGVAYYIIALGRLPWVALTVGISFSSYGVLRKKIQTGPIVGLYTETLMMLPFALALIIYFQLQHTAVFTQLNQSTDLWLVVGGLVTVVPLALFTTGARSLPMTSVGILFFITPSMQFVMGALILGEPVSTHKLIAFSIIWAGLVLYSISLFRGAARKETVCETAGED